MAEGDGGPQGRSGQRLWQNGQATIRPVPSARGLPSATAPARPRAGICLYPGVWESSAGLGMDLVHLAGTIAEARGGVGVEARFLGPRPGEVVTASRASMRAADAWGTADVDVLVLPSLALPSMDAAQGRPGLGDWVLRQHGRGCLVVAVSTGSWLLAETGLLDGHPATTHWACLDRCRRRHPAVGWTDGQRLAVAGRVLTARDLSAAATALCHVLGRLLGAPVAERTFRYALVHEPGPGALPLLHTVGLRDHGDAPVLAVQDWLEAGSGGAVSAAEAARLVHMSPRNLRRRFLAATGRTFSTYLGEVRLARARALLLSTDEPVSQVARRVGYEDASTFAALFRRRHGQTPSAYRLSWTDPLR